MKITKQIRFYCQHSSLPKGVYVDFAPIDKARPVPGYTHRVYLSYITEGGLIKHLCRDWLGDNAKPDKKAVEYFIQKHLPTIKKHLLLPQ